MVNDFKIARIPIIHFGSGKIKVLPELLRKYDGRILFILSKSFTSNFTHLKLIKSKLDVSNTQYDIIYSNGEPTVSSIDEIVSSFRHRNITIVCSIGGGSTIDTGKAVSAMLIETDSVENYLEGVGSKEVTGLSLPFIAIPTTAGTGSEATKNAVISRIGISGYKRSLRHENFVPSIALIDPELSLGCPSDITAASGMDAFTQLLESFLSSNSNPFTDAVSFKGLEAISRSLLKVYNDGHDLNARSDISLAALLSGISLANAGLGAVHGFASSIGGYFNIPHGIICGSLLAEVFKYNVKLIMEQNLQNEQFNKLVLLAHLFLPDLKVSGNELIMNFSDLLAEWVKILNIPKLGTFGITLTDVDRIVSVTDIKNNPVKLSQSNLREILINRI
jgi:alcohol dehydrogenase class IV